MTKITKGKIEYGLKIFIPIIVVIVLFTGGISVGIITFEPPEKNMYKNEVTATIIINFEDGQRISDIITTRNATVYNFLLKSSDTGSFTITSTYWKQYRSHTIDSITYNGTKYEADTNHYWAYYLNGQLGMEGPDNQMINNYDIIEWKYEEF